MEYYFDVFGCLWGNRSCCATVYMQIGAKQMVTGEIQRQMDTILKVDRGNKKHLA
jgi:hypothetical protein